MTFKEYLKERYNNINMDKIGDIFSFSRVDESENSIKFYGVYICDNIHINESVKQFDTIYAMEIMKNGELKIYEDISTVMSVQAEYNPFINLFKSSEPIVSTNINTIKGQALPLVISLIDIIKSVSIEDARMYLNTQGTSLEERVFNNMIHTVLFTQEEPSNGI